MLSFSYIGDPIISQAVKSLLVESDAKHIPWVEKCIQEIERQKVFNNWEINHYIYKILSMGYPLKNMKVFFKYLKKGWMMDQEVLSVLMKPVQYPTANLRILFNAAKEKKLTKWQKFIKWIRRGK